MDISKIDLYFKVGDEKELRQIQDVLSQVRPQWRREDIRFKASITYPSNHAYHFIDILDDIFF